MTEQIGTASAAVIGAGAIGTVVAAALAEAGRNVLLCTRRPRIGPIRVDHADGTRQYAVPALNSPTRAHPVDWVLVATKTYDTAGTEPWLRALVGPQTTVVVLQNGIGHAERVRPLLPSGTRILPAIVYVSAETLAPGHVTWSSGNHVDVPMGEAATDFQKLLVGSGLRAEATADFAAAAWQKLLVNMVINPITALTDRRMEVFANGDIRSLSVTMLTEAAHVAATTGVRLPDDVVDRSLALVDSRRPTDATSMYFDRLAGRPTEHEDLLGTVVQIADRHGVAVPAIRTVLALMRGLSASPAAA